MAKHVKLNNFAHRGNHSIWPFYAILAQFGEKIAAGGPAGGGGGNFFLDYENIGQNHQLCSSRESLYL